MPEPADVRAVVESYLSAHAEQDLENVLRLFAPDAVLEDPVGQPTHAGQTAIREFFRAAHRRNGRLRLRPVGPTIVCGDEASVHVRAAAQSADYAAEFDVIYVMALDSQSRIRSFRAFFER